MIYHQHEQGSDEWLESRRGVITGSRFKDARDRTAKGALTAKATLYAQDVARERCGGFKSPMGLGWSIGLTATSLTAWAVAPWPC